MERVEPVSRGVDEESISFEDWEVGSADDEEPNALED